MLYECGCITSGSPTVTNAPLTVEICTMIELNTAKVNVMIKTLNNVNLVQNSLRQALLYFTSKSMLKWCDGKLIYANDQRCDVNHVSLRLQSGNTLLYVANIN